MDLGCYLVDMIRYFSGQLPLVRKAEARVGPPKIDITMEAELELGDGIEAHISCSIASDCLAHAWFRALGNCGELMVTNPVAPHRGHLLVVRNGSGEHVEIVEGNTTYFHQLDAFVTAVGAASSATDSDGVINMRVIDQIYRAAGLPCRGIGSTPVGIIREAALT